MCTDASLTFQLRKINPISVTFCALQKIKGGIKSRNSAILNSIFIQRIYMVMDTNICVFSMLLHRFWNRTMYIKSTFKQDEQLQYYARTINAGP